MAEHHRTGKLAVILHADVAESTALVQLDERLAHTRIRQVFHRFADIISQYHGRVQEIRGDALLAEFERASDAVTAALALQESHAAFLQQIDDDLRPEVRVGIAMGEVIIADKTITGAGVVLAQRVEQLAEPGAVVIQSTAYETIPGRFPYEYRELGEYEAKGFDKPVQVYAATLKGGNLIPEPEQSAGTSRKYIGAVVSVTVVVAIVAILWFKPFAKQNEPVTAEQMATPLPEKPSIAVLPFNNMSGQTEQEYFVEGMTEVLITDLSKLSGLFVISRNSVFTYKDKAVKAQDVAQDLGVRYILEGSVRRAGDQVRIAVELAPSDAHARTQLAKVLVYMGKPNAALESLAQAARLDPYGESRRAYIRGLAEFGLGRFEEAAATLQQALDLNPGFVKPVAVMVSAMGYLGESDAAKLLKPFEDQGEWWANSVNNAGTQFPYQNKEDLNRFENGLRKAGLRDVF